MVILRVRVLGVLCALVVFLGIHFALWVIEQGAGLEVRQVICGYEQQAHDVWERNKESGAPEPLIVDCR